MQTSELTDYEKNTLLPRVKLGIKKRKGPHYAITARKIAHVLVSQGYDADVESVKNILHYIRTNGLVNGIIKDSTGFYVAESDQRIEQHIENLKEMKQSIDEIIAALESQRVESAMEAETEQQTENQ